MPAVGHDLDRTLAPSTGSTFSVGTRGDFVTISTLVNGLDIEAVLLRAGEFVVLLQPKLLYNSHVF